MIKSLLVSAWLFAAASAMAAGPSWFDGEWSGTVFQPDHGSYSIEVSADAVGESYHVSYATLACTARWDLISSSANLATFNEVTLTGTNCVNGRVIVTKVAAGRYASYSFFVEPGNVGAFTTMKKVAAR